MAGLAVLVAVGAPRVGLWELAHRFGVDHTSTTGGGQDRRPRPRPPRSPGRWPWPSRWSPAPPSNGGSLGTQGWRPSVLLAPIPTALVGKVEFYSDGVHTVLGPTGWTCSQTGAGQVASGLVVYPPGNANPPPGTIPPGGDRGRLRHLRHHRQHPGDLPGLPVLHHSLVAAERGPLLGDQARRRADLDAHPRRCRHHRPGRGGRNARGLRRGSTGDRSGDLPAVDAGGDRRIQCRHRRRVVFVDRQLRCARPSSRTSKSESSRCRCRGIREPIRVGSRAPLRPGNRPLNADRQGWTELPVLTPRRRLHTQCGDRSTR